MKKILSLLLMLTVCATISSSYTITAANSKQDPEKGKKEKKEKVKNIRISGIVTDEQGNCLEGVNIIFVRISESEPLCGVLTNKEGKYNIFFNSDRTLLFSLSGYESQKIEIKGRDEIDVVMKKLKK